MLSKMAVVLFTIVVVTAATSGARAQAPRPECVGPLEDRLKLVNQMNELDKIELPDDRIRDLHAVMAELKDALSGTASDSTKVAEKIEKAADKIQKVLPGAVKPLNQIADGLKKNTKMIGEVMKPIEQFDKALNYVDDLYSRTEGGTAKDQVLALQKVFDDMRKALPVSEVPGLKDLFDAYSQGIKGIADSVGNIEKQVDATNATMHQLWSDDGDPNLEGRDSIYLPNMSVRERLAAKKQALQKKMASIDKALDAAGCQRPGGPNQPDFTVKADPCFNQKPGSPGSKGRVGLENAKRKVADIERNLKNARDRIYPAWDREQKMNALVKALEHAVDVYQNAAQRMDKDIKGIDAQIAKEKSDQHVAELNVRAGGPDSAKWQAEADAHTKKIIELQQINRPKAVATQNQANSLLPDANARLAKARQEAADLHQMQDSIRNQIGKLQDQLGDALAKILATDAKAENWDPADYKALDDCRDRYFDKRVADRITPDKVKAGVPPPPAPPPAAASCPPPKGGGNGFAPIIEGVNRQIQGGNCR